MKLADLHTSDKPVSAVPFRKDGAGTVAAIQLRGGGHLKEHTTPVPATLVCVSGSVKYVDENGETVTLCCGDYHPIAPGVKHHLDGIEDSQLLLIK